MTIKHDNKKPRASLLPSGAVNAVIRVLEFGANKYAADNWKTVPDAKTRYYDAMQRHIDAWWQGEKKDPETSESHLAHAICCGMFLWWFDDMDEKVLKGEGFAARFVRKGDLEKPISDSDKYWVGQEVRHMITGEKYFVIGVRNTRCRISGSVEVDLVVSRDRNQSWLGGFILPAQCFKVMK